MSGSFQHRQFDLNKTHGFPVPKPDNDVAPGLPRSEAKAEVKPARWPLIVLALGGLVTMAWISLLAWLVFNLVIWLWA